MWKNPFSTRIGAHFPRPNVSSLKPRLIKRYYGIGTLACQADVCLSLSTGGCFYLLCNSLSAEMCLKRWIGIGGAVLTWLWRIHREPSAMVMKGGEGGFARRVWRDSGPSVQQSSCYHTIDKPFACWINTLAHPARLREGQLWGRADEGTNSYGCGQKRRKSVILSQSEVQVTEGRGFSLNI